MLEKDLFLKQMLFILTSNLLKNPEKNYHSFYKNITRQPFFNRQ